MTDGYVGNSSKPDSGWWLDRLQEGIAYREVVAYEESWDKWHRYYRGEWEPNVMPVNLFFTMMRTIVPRVYFRNPSVSITSAKPGPLFMGFAKLLERTDAKLIRQMRLKGELKRMVQDTFLYGTGIGTLGFGAVHEYKHEGFVEAPLVGSQQESIEYRDYISPNMPWFGRVHPRNYIVPAETEAPHTARWSAVIVERFVEDVKRDPRLRAVRKDIGAGRFSSITDRGVGAKIHRTGRYGRGVETQEIVELAVIRDKKTRQVIVMSAGGSEMGETVLYNGPDALQGSGFPDFILTFNPDPEYFWGVPDSQILEPYQLDINETRTQLMQQRRIALVKWLVQEERMEDGEIQKLLSPDVGAVAKVKGDPRAAALLTQLGDIPVSLFQALELNERDVRETVGFSRNQVGEFNSRTADTTATEAQIVNAASEIRVDERRDMISDLLVDIVEGIHSLIFNHWTTQEVVDVVGPGGAPVWVQFTPQMLAVGEYNVKVDPDNSLPETKQLREQRALALYERLKTNPMIDPFKLTQYLLHELHGTAFDDMMRALPPVSAGNKPINALEYGDLLRSSIGQADGRDIGRRLRENAAV